MTETNGLWLLLGFFMGCVATILLMFIAIELEVPECDPVPGMVTTTQMQELLDEFYPIEGDLP